MLFFDPVLRGVFGGDLASASEILADDTGIELLIARLEERTTTRSPGTPDGRRWGRPIRPCSRCARHGGPGSMSG